MRDLSARMKLFAKIIAVAFAFFYLYTSGFGIFSTESNRGIYLLCTNVLCILLYPASKKNPKSRLLYAVDIVILVATATSIIYWMNQYAKYTFYRVGMPNQWDFWFGVILIITSLEITRRVMGNVLAALGLIFVIQLYLGPYLPSIFAHKGFTITRIVEFNYSTTEGIFGTIVSVFATYVMPFLIFGAFLNRSGGGDFFIDLARALAGTVSGGPALIATFGSAVFGSISGSPVANVVATGTFTIPLMKRVGYKPEFAGAVEAAASTGGQFLPPVMGAGAFILATLTETPYSTIMRMAVVPALFYYLSLATMVYFNAKKNNLEGLKREELPDVRDVLKKGWYFAFAVVLAIVLIMLGYSPALTAFCATVFVFGCSFIRKETRFTLNSFIDTLEEAARSSIVVGSTAGTLGLVMGGITLSGLGVKFSAMILSLSQGSIFLTIILIALIATIVGMGLPTTASYIVLAILAAPALIQLGIDPVPAHLACFWLSMTSNITPPVCVASFAGASIAKADPMKTGIQGFKIGIFLYIMPFIMIYAPQLLLEGNAIEIMEIIVSYIFATVAFSVAMQGWFFRQLSIWLRTLYLVASVLMFFPNFYMDLIGLVIFFLVSSMLYRENKVALAS